MLPVTRRVATIAGYQFLGLRKVSVWKQERRRTTSIIILHILRIRRGCDSGLVRGGIHTWECRALHCDVVLVDGEFLAVCAWEDHDGVAFNGFRVCICDLASWISYCSE